MESNHIRTSIIVAISLLGTGIFLVLMGMHLRDEIAWHQYYEKAHIIERCEYGVGKWPGSFDAVIASPPETKVGKMPYRGTNQNIKTPVEKVLYTKCMVPVVGESQFFSAGKVFGDTQVFVNGQLRQTINGSGEIELVLVSTQAQFHTFEVVSRGDSSEVVGLASLIPIYTTNDSTIQKAIERYRLATYIEQPVFRIGFAVVVLIMMAFLWRYGLHYFDLFWLAGLAGAVCCENFILYAYYVFPDWESFLVRAEGVSIIAVNVSIVFFLIGFVRNITFAKWLKWVAGIGITGFLGLIVFAPEDLYYNWRLQGQLQTYLATLALLGLLAYLSLRYFRIDLHQFEKERIRFVIIVAIVTAAVLFIQALIEDQFALYLAPLVQAMVIAGFTIIMLRDLVKRHRLWLAERQRRYQLERISHQHRARIEIGNMLAHDLKRPLELFALLPDNPTSEQLQQARRAGDQSLQLLENLTFVDTKATVNTLPTNAAAVIRSAWQTVSWKDKTKSNILNFEIKGIEGLILNVDPLAFARICQNLLGNAFDLIKESEVVRVIGRQLSDSLQLQFFNSGTYISEQDRQAVFQRFWSGGKGQGLGLAIVRELVEAHGGKIDCTSETKVGTAFTITLPKSTVVERGEIEKPSGNPFVQIAVVDDDEIVLTAWQVANIEAEVSTFQSPEAFLQSMQDGALAGLDAVLLDIEFKNSEMNGMQLAEKLLNLRPELPVFITSQLVKGRLSANIKGRVGKNPKAWMQMTQTLI